MTTPSTNLTLSAVRQVQPGRWGSAEQRFWSRVNKTGPVNPRRPELGPCWLWTGSSYTDKRGNSYGQMMLEGIRTGAHRVAYRLFVGPIPDGLDVMHQCDVKRCVRPDHLETGTRSENIRDGFANPANDGACAGENNGRARLTWDDVHAIRAAEPIFGSTTALAKQYGVTTAQISAIKHGRKWPESKCPTHSAQVAA